MRLSVSSQHAVPSARRQRQARRQRPVCVCVGVAPRAVPSLSRPQAQLHEQSSAGARFALLPGVLRASPLPETRATSDNGAAHAAARGNKATDSSVRNAWQPHRLVVWIRISGRETALRDIQRVWQPRLLVQHRPLVSLRSPGQQARAAAAAVPPAARGTRRTLDSICWSRVSSVSSSAWCTRVAGSAPGNASSRLLRRRPHLWAQRTLPRRAGGVRLFVAIAGLFFVGNVLYSSCARGRVRASGATLWHHTGAPSRPRTRATGSSGSLSETSAEYGTHG